MCGKRPFMPLFCAESEGCGQFHGLFICCGTPRFLNENGGFLRNAGKFLAGLECVGFATGKLHKNYGRITMASRPYKALVYCFLRFHGSLRGLHGLHLVLREHVDQEAHRHRAARGDYHELQALPLQLIHLPGTNAGSAQNMEMILQTAGTRATQKPERMPAQAPALLAFL